MTPSINLSSMASCGRREGGANEVEYRIIKGEELPHQSTARGCLPNGCACIMYECVPVATIYLLLSSSPFISFHIPMADNSRHADHPPLPVRSREEEEERVGGAGVRVEGWRRRGRGRPGLSGLSGPVQWRRQVSPTSRANLVCTVETVAIVRNCSYSQRRKQAPRPGPWP